MKDYCSHMPISLLATMYCIIFDGDVTKLMFTMTSSTVKSSTICRSNITARILMIKQHFKQ